MIRKVAVVQALREAFPDRFQGMYAQEEFPEAARAKPLCRGSQSNGSSKYVVPLSALCPQSTSSLHSLPLKYPSDITEWLN